MCEVPNGPDSPCTLIIDVEQSDYYKYENLSGNYTSFCAVSSNFFASIAGDGIGSAEFNAVDNAMYIDGNNITYRAWLRNDVEGYEHFYLEGDAGAAFSVSSSNQNIVTNGLSGSQICGFSDINSIFAETITYNFSNHTAFDLSEIEETGLLHIVNEENSEHDVVISIDALH